VPSLVGILLLRIATRTIAMFNLKCKIVRRPTCDFRDRNPLKGFEINSR